MYKPEADNTDEAVRSLTALIAFALKKRSSLDCEMPTDETSHYRDLANKRVTELRRIRSEVEDLMYGAPEYRP